ncbi:MAG: galactose mutarotase [Akkermansiaceae bacterium]|nr:galactose mutarotase [Akkermansiaceae bacterium]
MKSAIFLLPILALGACTKEPSAPASKNSISEESYGKLPDGSDVAIYTLTNKNGMSAKVTEYGAILVGLEVPDKDGKTADVTHGYDSLEGWLTNTSYFGSTVGRYGNRIAHGKFSLNGEGYSLATNNDPGGIPCALHGGLKGFDKVLWSGKTISKDGSNGVELTYVSKDGEEGYPGELTAVVTYILTDDNELIWEAKATVTGKSTPLNIVHHSYWNLSNDQMSSINDHVLTLDADHYLPTDAGLIPTGKLDPVTGTPFDFTKPTAIGDRVGVENEALTLGGGYDHCWVLTKKDGLRHAATLHDPKTGRTMDISTDQPGIQFYGGNFLDGTATGKNGEKYPFRSACCLETQVYPDSPNQPDFPSSILKPGETYSHTMVHKFSW